MNKLTIVERRFPLDHYLVRKIFGTMSIGKNSDAYGQIVYYNESNPQVITAKLVYIQDWEAESKSFCSLIEEDVSFNECLLISTLYFNKPTSTIKTILQGKVEPIEDFLKHIVQQTNGYLVYSFQFEQLAQLMLNVPLDEAVRLRRLYNKMPSSFIRSCDSDDENLGFFKDTIRARNISGSVQIPNYQGALNLFHYATSFA